MEAAIPLRAIEFRNHASQVLHGDGGRQVGAGKPVAIQPWGRIEIFQPVHSRTDLCLKPGAPVRIAGAWRAPRIFQAALVDFLGQTDPDHLDLQHPAAIGLLDGGQLPGRGREAVQVVDDRAAIEQRLAVVQDQGRDLAQRVHLQHGLEIGEHGHHPPLERQAGVVKRDGHPAHERGIVLADQDHAAAALSSLPVRHGAGPRFRPAPPRRIQRWPGGSTVRPDRRRQRRRDRTRRS